MIKSSLRGAFQLLFYVVKMKIVRLYFFIFILYEETARHRSCRRDVLFHLHIVQKLNSSSLMPLWHFLLSVVTKGSKNTLSVAVRLSVYRKMQSALRHNTRQRLSTAFTQHNSFNKTVGADADVGGKSYFSTTCYPPCVRGSGSGQGQQSVASSNATRGMKPKGYPREGLCLYLPKGEVLPNNKSCNKICRR